ncbi:MAG: secondary thiamine-phosphate synthase enzyme YjbQ [Candidatus Polarisedimenticolia bacterium]
MKLYHAASAVRTSARISVENVTKQVREAVEASGVTTGLAVVSVPHTTCAVAVNEDEAGLRKDILKVAERLLTPLAGTEGFSHDCVDDNAQAHLTSILFGHTATVPVSEGGPSLGSWQSIFLIELDGPRTRSVNVTVIGE